MIDTKIVTKKIPVSKLGDVNVYNEWTREYESRIKDIVIIEGSSFCFLIIEKKGSYPFVESQQDKDYNKGTDEH